MFRSRGMYCGCCSRKRLVRIENGALKFICKECYVSIISKRQNDERVSTTYRFANKDWFLKEFYCENCKTKHEVNSDCKREINFVCSCNYSIKAKRSNSDDLIVTSYLIKE